MINAVTPQATGPLTLADVRTALGDTDVNATNAGALRAILGRGSNATVQKHLDTLRAERAPVVPLATGAAPAAPAEVVAAIWSAAWGQAQALTLGGLTTAIAQRDAALEQAARLTLERDTFAGDLDAELAHAEQAQADALAAEVAKGAELATVQALAATLQAELAQARAEVKAVQLAAENAGELARRDALLLTEQHRANTEHLLNQLADLKSALHAPRPTVA